MIGKDVWKWGEGRLFMEMKLGCRCREEWHIKHCWKQNALLLNSMTGKAVKHKIICEQNRGMGSVLTEYVAETFRAIPPVL